MSAAFPVSVIFPAKDESETIGVLVARVRELLPSAEVIVVDDGSGDDTKGVAEKAGARVLRHPSSRGNGAAVKTGVRNARGEVLVLLDADGQHDPADIARLLAEIDAGFDLVVGARNAGAQASIGRLLANGFYNRLAGWMVGQRVDDLTSGFRAVRADKMREFVHLFPNGFSYPATSTMAFFRAGYGVRYVPLAVGQRLGTRKSHIRLFRDGFRFFLIIFRVATLYSPLKIFTPISAGLFLGAIGYASWTLLQTGRFTLFSALLFMTSMLTFLIGLVSEQITQLLYARQNNVSGQE